MYERKCPQCNRIISYPDNPQGKYSHKRALQNNSICKTCVFKRVNDEKIRYGEANPFYGKSHTKATKDKISKKNKGQRLGYKHSDETKRKMSESQLGEKNHRFGKPVSDETKLKLSLKNSGSGNPMYGKPSPQKSGNGYKGWYKEHFFRSLMELTFMLWLDDNQKIWQSAESQEYKISYTAWNGQVRNYFPDFISENIIYEVKPKRLWNTPLVKSKANAAIEQFRKQNLEYKLVDHGILNSQRLKSLIDEGLVIVTDTTKTRIESYDF